MKRIKFKLKEWHREHCDNVDERLVKAKEDLHQWDLKGELESFLDEDLQAHCGYIEEVERLSHEK